MANITYRTVAVVLLSLVRLGVVAGQPVNPDAARLAEFTKRVQAYVELHRKLEAELPPLARDAAMETRFKHEMALASRIRLARRGAGHGNIWPSDVRALVRRILANVMVGPSGKNIRSALIEDEVPLAFPLVVNAPYPEGAAFSTMPPQLLAALPPLPEELEYRFVRTTLILRDGHANLIVDYIQRAIR